MEPKLSTRVQNLFLDSDISIDRVHRSTSRHSDFRKRMTVSRVDERECAATLYTRRINTLETRMNRTEPNGAEVGSRTLLSLSPVSTVHSYRVWTRARGEYGARVVCVRGAIGGANFKAAQFRIVRLSSIRNSNLESRISNVRKS